MKAADKAGQKWQATAATKFAKPRDHPFSRALYNLTLEQSLFDKFPQVGQTPPTASLGIVPGGHAGSRDTT